MSLPIRCLLLLALLLTAPVAFAAPTLFAAASLKPVLDHLADSGVLGHPAPQCVYAASSQLARQIAQGAPADVYISADAQWMDYLATQQRIVPASRRDLLANTLVMVAAPGSGIDSVRFAPDALDRALGSGRLAVALIDSVPAGIYARQSLENLGLWNTARDRLAPARDVRAALALVTRGETPLGIVYGSDAVSAPETRVVARFPASSHTPIVYPAAIINGHDSTEARALLQALASPAAAATFRHYGFKPLAAGP